MSDLALIPSGPAAYAYAEYVRKFMDIDDYPQPRFYDWRFAVQQAVAGHWQLWFGVEDEAPHIMMLTYVNELPAGKTCTIELLVGAGLLSIIDKLSSFDAWCRLQGIVAIQATTRPTIARLLERNGWTDGGFSVFKRLDRTN